MDPELSGYSWPSSPPSEPAAGGRRGGLTAKRSELAEVRRRIDGMILAIEAGLFEPSMKERMQGLERRREALEAELAAAAEPKPRLHPNLAEVYRQKVAALHEALAAEDGGHEVREAMRALVEAVVLVPDDGRLAIEVRGDLAAILALGQNASTRRRAGSLRICWCK